MKIYLDTNILIDCYEGKHKEFLDALRRLKQEDSIQLPYSSTHIEEICNFKMQDKQKQNAEIKSRLDFISELTSNLYFCNDMVSTQCKEEHPTVVYETINFMPTKIDYKALLANLISYDALKNSRNQLNLDPHYLNNIKPVDSIKEIDKYLSNASKQFGQTYSGDISVIELLRKGLEISEDAHKGSGYHNIISKKESYHNENVIVTLFSLLDSFGFWSDKKENYSTGSQYGDAIHCFNGSNCDYVISNDLRFCNKSLAVYEYLNAKTGVFHLQKDYLEIKTLLRIAT